jgi:hypothetical protein
MAVPTLLYRGECWTVWKKVDMTKIRNSRNVISKLCTEMYKAG